MNKKVGMVSLGCPKNTVDSEIMLGRLKEKGYTFTQDEKEAEIIIVNTCGFIESAKQESINTILEMAENKKQKCEVLVVTGCLAQRYLKEIEGELPEVDILLGTGSYGDIADAISKYYSSREKIIAAGDNKTVDYLDNERVLTTRNGSAYLKIAEGCDNCCTYCIIPKLRGSYRSRNIEEILKEAGALVKNGANELILVAQDTTRYGIDLYGSRKLVDLIKRLSEIEDLRWIRLLYCYPEEIDDLLIDEIAGNKKVLKYLDIPVQHASDSILEAMGRRGRLKDITGLLNRLKSKIPDIVIRTSIIVGFPGESEKDFDTLKSFVKEAEFDRLGVFTYSKEDGTKAAKLKNQIPNRTKLARQKMIMQLQAEITCNKNTKRIGNVYETLVEGVAEDGIFYKGRSYAESPDIDPVIYYTSSEPLENGQFVNVKILNIDDYDIIGEAVHEST